MPRKKRETAVPVITEERVVTTEVTDVDASTEQVMDQGSSATGAAIIDEVTENPAVDATPQAAPELAPEPEPEDEDEFANLPQRIRDEMAAGRRALERK